MKSPSEVDIPRNPAYGSGVFRRRILLTRKSDTQILCALEDCSHAMQLTLIVLDNSIAQIHGEVLRAPVDICSSAPMHLAAFAGLELHDDSRVYAKHTPPNSHCTHLFDMTMLSISFALSGKAQRRYDVNVADEKDGVLDATIYLDDTLVHHWLIRDAHIISPSSLKGIALYKGFFGHMHAHFVASELDCAKALQKGIMVAGARRWNMAAIAGSPADNFGPGINICHSYSEQRIHLGKRSHNPSRDFSDTLEQLLKFQ